MKKQLLFIFLLPAMLFSQTTIWEEDFESYEEFTGVKGPNAFLESAGYSQAAETKWVLDASLIELSNTSDYFYINISSSGDGEIYARDLDGQAVFTTQNIDISSETGNVTIKIDKLDFEAFTSGDFSGTEYVDIYYSLDNGVNYIIIPNQGGSENTSGHTFADDGAKGVDFSTSLDFSFDPETATSVKVMLKMYNNGSNERFEIDDISVSRNSNVLWSENFDSYSDDYGYVGDDTVVAAKVNSGDYPGSVTKWTLTPSVDFLNQNDYVAVKSGMLRFNDVDNAVTFETENIDITSVSVLTYSMDVSFGSSLDGDEFLDIYYSIDGGVTYIKEGTGAHTYEATVNITESSTVNFSKELSGLSAANFRIKIVGINDSNVEDFVIDNIKVVKPSTAGVDEVFTSSLKLYPNPLSNNKVLYIDSPLNSPKEIQIFNLLGKEIVALTTSKKSMKLNSLNKGIYIIKIVQENKTAVKRLIIN